MKRQDISKVLKLLGERVCAHDSSCARELTAAMQSARPSDQAIDRRMPQQRPAVAAALCQAEPPLRDALEPLADELPWRKAGFGKAAVKDGDVPLVVELVGSTGVLTHPAVSLGLIVLGPKLHYLDHSHAAEELYLTLAGELNWQIDRQNIGPVLCGQFVHHRPWQRHSMTTGERPALLFWGWTGDIRPDTYTTHQPGFQKSG